MILLVTRPRLQPLSISSVCALTNVWSLATAMHCGFIREKSNNKRNARPLAAFVVNFYLSLVDYNECLSREFQGKLWNVMEENNILRLLLTRTEKLGTLYLYPFTPEVLLYYISRSHKGQGLRCSLPCLTCHDQ